MMEGTANYVARVAVGQSAECDLGAPARITPQADAIRWRFYDSGAALCFLLDRFQPDWKSRIDSEPDLTIADLLDAARAREAANTSRRSLQRSRRDSSAARSTDIAELSTRQRLLRDDLLGRAGPRIVIEIPDDEEPLRLTRFDPINLLVLGAREVAHANYLTFARHDGTIELTNPGFARGSFAGTVALDARRRPSPVG